MRPGQPACRERADRGAADALGLVILIVPMMLFAVLVFYVGRDVDQRAQVRSAAESAAQAAALERNAGAASAAANEAAISMLDPSVCPTPVVLVDYPPDPPPGSTDIQVVEVVLSCSASNAGFRTLNETGQGQPVPSSQDNSVTAYATLDFFRARR